MSKSEWAKWVALQDAPWGPPSSLQMALNKMEAPRVWLSHAVDIMAFGDEGAPVKPRRKTQQRGYTMEVTARRCQASRALCEAAQKGVLSVIGAPHLESDASEEIASKYFDTPRQLGSEDNSLETDPGRIPEGRSIRARRGHVKWFNVRIETQSLLAWLRSLVQTDASRAEYHLMRSVGGKVGAASPALESQPLGTKCGHQKDRGKIPAVIKELAVIFPSDRYPKGVPDPAYAPRQMLISDLLERVPSLGKKLDPTTLKTAIGRYNNSFENNDADPN